MIDADADAIVTRFAAPSSSTLKFVADGLETVKFPPRAVPIAVTAPAKPPEKSIPTTVSLGFEVSLFANGKSVVSSTRIRVIVLVVPLSV